MTNENLKKVHPSSHKINMEYNGSFNQDILVIGCSHLDSVYTDKKLFLKHLNQARERNAPVLFLGDNNDLMQGQGDKRGRKKDLKPELMSCYIDDVVDETVELLKPYADLIWIFGLGNHELSIIKRYETNVAARIVEKLNLTTGSNIQLGGYSGYMKIILEYENHQGRYQSINLYYSHSSGSIGMRSKGALAFDILAAKYPSADIYLTAHSHESLMHPFGYEYLSTAGVVSWKEKLFLQLPSYKMEWGEMERSGWWHETNKNPRVLGGWWINLYYEAKEIKWNATMAK